MVSSRMTSKDYKILFPLEHTGRL